MSSANTKSNLENASPLDGHENNDCDNDGPNQSDSKIEESTAKTKSRSKKYLHKMLRLLKEFLIMVLVAITYAAVTNDSPKIGKSPAAYRFFGDDPHITDWYRGEISEAISQARSADIAFVMFYAPWDAECQHARREFKSVAQFMHQEVTFSAVNCWQPGSECKTQYSKVYKWPIFIAYPTHGRGVQYNGPLVGVYMMQFLKKIISPFNRGESFVKHLARYDAVIVGKVNAAPYSKDYGVFYQTTLRLLEKDPLQEIGVSIETQPAYDEQGGEIMPELALYMWNETMFYPSSEEWEIDHLLNWIVKHVHQVTNWISPSGMKSLSLASHLQPGPALIFFTPKNPLANHNDFYSMLREVALEYNYCEGNTWINILRLRLRIERRAKYLEQLRFIEECSRKKFKIRKIISPNLWSNTSYCLEKKYQTENPFVPESSMVHYYGGMSGLCVELLKNLDNKDISSTKMCSEVKTQGVIYKTSQLNDMPDDSPDNLKNHAKRESCKSFLIAQKYQPLVFSSGLYNEESIKIEGIGCRKNGSLSFIVMDSLYYHHFAEKLGIDLSRRPNKSAVVILDNKMETHYIMTGVINESNLKSFIYNYTRRSVTRALSSLTTVNSKNTHSYPQDRQNSFDDAKFSITELSASNFVETISQTNKAVIVFFYSKQCSFCNGISHRFLTVAKYFSAAGDFHFARIDGDLNLLPWEYTMDIYPTILFVPPERLSESRVFPMGMPITVPNLVGFILANLPPSWKLEAMWTLCENSKFYSNATLCHSSLRLQISSTIDKVLHEWRQSSCQEDRSTSSMKLEHLHDLYTLFMDYPHNTTLVEYHFASLKLIELTPPETVAKLK